MPDRIPCPERLQDYILFFSHQPNKAAALAAYDGLPLDAQRHELTKAQDLFEKSKGGQMSKIVGDGMTTVALALDYWYRKLEGRDATGPLVREYLIARHGMTHAEAGELGPWDVVEILKADCGQRSPPPPQEGPFGSVINHNAHTVQRCDKHADFGAKRNSWELFLVLARDTNNYHSLAACRKVSDATDPGTLAVIVNELRGILEPVGLGIENKRSIGYILTDLHVNTSLPKPKRRQRR